MRPRYQHPGEPTYEEIRRSSITSRVVRLLGRRVSVVWKGKDPEQLVEISSAIPVTDVELLRLWKDGIPLGLPLMERARSVMVDPTHEPEVSLLVGYFSALAKSKGSPLDKEMEANFAEWMREKLSRNREVDHTCPSCEPDRWAALGQLDTWHSAEAFRRDVMGLGPTCPRKAAA